MCSGLLRFSVKVCWNPLNPGSVIRILMQHDYPVRVVSFAMRAALAKSESAGENFDLVLAEQIIYGVGFFGILYAAYITVLDRCDQLVASVFQQC